MKSVSQFLSYLLMVAFYTTYTSLEKYTYLLSFGQKRIIVPIHKHLLNGTLVMMMVVYLQF